MATLTVNIDHIATLRQAIGASEPDPVQAAVLAELAGAHGITVHLREDRRHIQDRDVYLLKQIVKTRLNLEVTPSAEMVGIAVDVLPHIVTLVPDHREERGNEGGLSVRGNEGDLAKTIAALQDNSVDVCLCIDPDVQQVKAAKRIGATHVELHTGHYANASGGGVLEELERLRDASFSAHNLGLQVHAGSGLNYANVAEIANLRRSEGELIDELVVGHAVVARASLVGMETAVHDMLSVI